MKLIKQIAILFLFLLSLSLLSCSNDDTNSDDDPQQNEATENPSENNEEEEEEEVVDLQGEVDFFNSSFVEDSYVLVNNASANRAYIMNKEAELLFEWELSNNIGNDVFLLPDGRLLALLEADTQLITFGGKGGKIQLIDKESTILWNFDYSTEDYTLHHDVEMLPNGNIIAMVWEKKTEAEAEAAGSNLDHAIYPEAVIEVNPQTSEIVWEWHAWDHIIQDFDNTKANFGVVADNPHLIDLNYVPNELGDIMHGNGISYDADRDIIFLSINFYSEVWVIDHSTTTSEASTGLGGTYGKGGDLVYRFGNPDAYDNPMGERLFYNNHFPNLLPKQGTGERNMLIFVNKLNGMEQSAVYELAIPEILDLQANTDNEPELVWSFTHPELYADKLSGAVRLENGNTLITQGNSGYWEVLPDGKVAWRFYGEGLYWRGYDYAKDAPEIIHLGL